MDAPKDRQTKPHIELRVLNLQVMQGHNIVADGWAGAANPHPNPTPHSIPLPTQTPSKKASKTLVFPLFHLCTQMEGWMDGRTDRQMDGQT